MLWTVELGLELVVAATAIGVVDVGGTCLGGDMDIATGGIAGGNVGRVIDGKDGGAGAFAIGAGVFIGVEVGVVVGGAVVEDVRAAVVVTWSLDVVVPGWRNENGWSRCEIIPSCLGIGRLKGSFLSSFRVLRLLTSVALVFLSLDIPPSGLEFSRSTFVLLERKAVGSPSVKRDPLRSLFLNSIVYRRSVLVFRSVNRGWRIVSSGAIIGAYAPLDGGKVMTSLAAF